MKLLSLTLILVLLTGWFSGLCENAHALEQFLGGSQAVSVSSEGPHECPGCPHEHHSDNDGCDTCINCACHAPLTTQKIQLGYHPIIQDLHTSDPFRFLPEVYLPKFIPPQNQA